MKIGLVIPIYNRPEYVKRCFDSLRKLTTKPDVIILVDDASTNSEAIVLSQHFVNDCKHASWIQNEKNLGVKGALLKGIEYAFKESCSHVINLDSDAIVKPDFISRLLDVHKQTDLITSGFNNPNEITVGKVFKDLCFKQHANGINMCFNREQYERYVKPALLSTGNWDFNTKAQFAIAIPSCVQHIGMQSSMGHVGADVAHDFKQLHLPNVTLFGIDSHDPQGIQRAAEISQRNIEFGTVKIITDDLFTKGGGREIRRMDYSRFMMKELTNHFNTSHVLTIHEDGYVLNWQAWDDEWLQYDYIGGTWWYKDNMNVGNGGFSLRSKKLCDILANHHIDEEHMHPEDHHISRTFRPSLEKDFGIKFAPEEVANKFSIEAYGVPPPYNKYNGAFGFHGVHVDFSTAPQYDVSGDVIYRKQLVPTPAKKVNNNFRKTTYGRR